MTILCITAESGVNMTQLRVSTQDRLYSSFILAELYPFIDELYKERERKGIPVAAWFTSTLKGWEWGRVSIYFRIGEQSYAMAHIPSDAWWRSEVLTIANVILDREEKHNKGLFQYILSKIEAHAKFLDMAVKIESILSDAMEHIAIKRGYVLTPQSGRLDDQVTQNAFLFPDAAYQAMLLHTMKLRSYWLEFTSNYREWEKDGLSTQEAQQTYDRFTKAIANLDILFRDAGGKVS